MASSRIFGAVRQFSTSAARANLVRAPIQVFGIEGRYAHALYSAASKEKKLDVVEKELLAFQTNLDKDTKLKGFILDPSVRRQDKQGALKIALDKQKVSTITANLFDALAENGRVKQVSGVINAFEKIMSAHRGEVLCSVTTAKPLDANNLKQVEAALQAFMKQGEKLQLETKVDPALIGGMVVIIGDKYVDMSMATKINAYTNLIKQAV